MKEASILVIIFLALITAIPYLNTVQNPFMWDEEVVIVGNPLIKDMKYLPQIFKTDIFGGDIKAKGYFRPIYTLSFMFNYKLGGLNPAGYHIFNISLHVINVILVYFLALRLGLPHKASLLMSLFFSLFPVNSETVTLIGARTELILGFFLLSSFLFYLKGLKGGNTLDYLFSTCFLALGIVTKESFIVLPFIILSYVLIFLKKKEKINFPLMALIGIAVGYTLIRLSLMKSADYKTLSLIHEASFMERLFTFPKILLTYIGLVIFPLQLNSEYDFVVRNMQNIYVWLGIPALILLGYLIVRYLKPQKYALFFLLWFLIGLLPYYNILIALHATLLETWVYFAGIGLAGIMSIGVIQFYEAVRFKWAKSGIVILLCLLFGYYMFKTVNRNNEWHNPFLLYKLDSQKEPDSFLLHCNLGVEYFRRGMMKEAKDEFIASNKASPHGQYDVACNNLGVIYGREGNIEEAIAHYKKSIELNNYPLAYGNLGEIYNNMQRYKDTIQLLEKGRQLYPLNVEILYQLGKAYYYTNEITLARSIFVDIGNITGGGYKDIQSYIQK